MSKYLDRFQEPRSSDENYNCEGCGRKFHFSLLNDEGYCERCAELIKPNEEEQEHQDQANQ